jgi:heme/copper-type cytochrome/quinol oxidase subunit 3
MGGLVFAMFAAIYYWLPKMTGLRFREGLAKWHFWTLFIAFNSTFLPLFLVGARGMARRISSYDQSFAFLNRWASISAFCILASMMIFLVNFVWSQFLRRESAADNPWGSRGLEFQVPTPVPAHNFAEIPLVQSAPYEYGVPGAPPVADLAPQGRPDPVDADGNPAEDPDRTPGVVRAGSRIFALSVLFFFSAFAFAFFYLQSLDSRGRWNAGDLAPGRPIVVAAFVAVLLAAVASARAVRAAKRDAASAWSAPIGVACISVAGAVVLAIIGLVTLPFEPSAGGYASVYVGWTLALIAAGIGMAYWTWTIRIGALRRRDADAAGSGATAMAPTSENLVASVQGYWDVARVLVGVTAVAFVLLVLVR